MEKFISGLPRDYFLEPTGEPDAYIIAMPKKEDKARKTAQELGMNTAGVRAVIGGAVPSDMALIQNRHLFDDKSRGCYLSHMKVYHDFLKTNKEAVLVMEDDAMLTDKKEFDKFIEVSKEMMAKDKPMISFAGLCWPKFGEEIGNTGMHEYKGGACTHGFLINRKAAQVLLNKPMNTPIDIQIAKSKEITRIMPNRFVLEQGSKDPKKSSSWTKVTNDRETKFPPKKPLSTDTNGDETKPPVLPFVTAMGLSLIVGFSLRSRWYENYWMRHGGGYSELQEFRKKALGFYVFAAVVPVIYLVKLYI